MTTYDASPQTAIDTILAYTGPVLLDLDETLYLRNSTEDFIDSAYPRLPALLLMRALDVIKPWRWTGGEATRDIWRVRFITSCLPWSNKRWQRRVTGLAKDYTNQPLLAAVTTPGMQPIITTSGFIPIVTPLVAALGLPQARIVAARLSTCSDRREGKLHMAINALGQDTVQRALVLTDSIQDLTLLDACARPLRTIWPEAKFHRALSNVYLPGQYLTHIKRPGARYIVRGILQEDFVFWVLSSIALASLPILHVLGLLFLLLSFWGIYERGYVDNDLTAKHYEAEPKLSSAFHESPVATPRWQPWIWATISGAIAIVILRWPLIPLLTEYASWAAVLLGTYFWFTLYNRFDKSTRVWMFAGLQFARSTAFVALVPIGLIGAVALSAHVIAKWVPYYIYRLGGKEWPEAPFHLIRLLFFVVLALMLGLTNGFTTLWNGTALALLIWNLYRARQELTTAFSAAKQLDQTNRNTPL